VLGSLGLFSWLTPQNLDMLTTHLREQREDEIHPSREEHQLILSIVYDYLATHF